MGRILEDFMKNYADCAKCKYIDLEIDCEKKSFKMKCKKNLPVSLTVGRCAEYKIDKHVIECH